MARGRNGSLQRATVGPRRSYAAHPLSMRPVVIGLPVRAVRAGRVLRGQPSVKMRIARPGRIVVQRVRPVVAYAARDPVTSRPLALLSGSRNTLKQRKLCKCQHERSAEQKRVSRRFYSGFGGRRGEKVRVHSCAC